MSVKRADGSPGLPALLSFLNCTKYPASFDFLLMTLGPIIALMPWLEPARGAFARAVALFGRVPFFFYVLHIPLIHALALIVSKIRLGFVSPLALHLSPHEQPRTPDGYIWSLPLLYLVWVIAVAILYFPCRWFADVKATSSAWWLEYL